MRYLKMPTECITNPLQRELADSIIRMVPLDEIRILLACGAKVNQSVTQGLMPLHYAVWQRYFEAVQLLLVRGSNINLVDDCGYSALHLAAEHGYNEIVKLLLQSGAKVDYRENNTELYPRTISCDEPLRLAIRNKHIEIAKVLLEHGADPNKRYFFGSEINLVTDLDFLELLLTFGASPESRDRSGLTPLMKFSRQSHNLEQVLLLINYGADVNAMTDERNDFRTVLHYAVLSGNVQTVNLLIKQGAKLNYDSNEFGKPSPLDLAILKGDLHMVRLLIAAGADVNSSSPIIGSPLHVACADNISNRIEILQLLLSRGADPNMKVFGDSNDRNSQLRPALVEYLASNDKPNAQVVNLMLRYGAKVVMKTQFRDPDGLLNSLQNLPDGGGGSLGPSRHPSTTSEDPPDTDDTISAVWFLLLEASEAFDPCMIKRCGSLSRRCRSQLMSLASTPLPLTRQCRILVRRTLFPGTMPDVVDKWEIPATLKRFLLFDYS